MRRQSERVEHTLPQHALVGAAVARDHLTQEREGEVRVVPQATRAEHELGVREAREELLARRSLHRLPHRPGASRCRPDECVSAWRTVGPPGSPSTYVASGASRSTSPSSRSCIDDDRREGLGDRADAVGMLRRRRLVPLDVGEPERPLPQDLAAREHGRADRREPPLGLGLAEPPVERGDAARQTRAAASASGTRAHARSMSSSPTSRCVTARITVGWIVDERPTPASRRRPSASSRSSPSLPDVHLHEVRLHLLEIDRQPRAVPRLGQPPRPRVVVGQAVDVVVEGVDACRRDDARLPHGAAEQVLLTPGPLHQRARSGQHGPERAAEALREADRDGVEPALRSRPARRPARRPR